MQNRPKGYQSVSIIMPAYRAETVIISSLRRLKKVLEREALKYEIICVVDGKEDKTYELARGYFAKDSKVKIYGYKKNRGKGYAVRYGFKKAEGKIVGFIDAGFEIDPASLIKLLDKMEKESADIVVGSKRHPDSKVLYPPIRKVFSQVYSYFVKILFRVSVSDTQAGIKVFRREVTKELLPLLRINGFAFDIEILTLAKARGFSKIFEAPIVVKMAKGDKSSTIGSFFGLVRASFEMIRDSLAIFVRINKIV